MGKAGENGEHKDNTSSKKKHRNPEDLGTMPSSPLGVFDQGTDDGWTELVPYIEAVNVNL